MTAADLAAKLRTNPEFVAQQGERERQRTVRSARLRAEEEPILADLRGIGLNVESVWDLVNTSATYTEAIPVLVKHLLLPYSDRTREGIARSLAVPEARQAWPTLVAEYRRAPMGEEHGIRLGAKDGLAVALSLAATDAVMEELVSLAKDRAQGSSRLLLLSALKRSGSAVAKQALKELASDPDLRQEIASWR